MSNPQHPVSNSFPICGIIGIISSDPSELKLATQKALHSIEIRADLLLDNGHSVADILSLIADTKKCGISSLFTLRHASQGGKFDQDEQQRVAICRQAVAAGTDIIDLEWGMDSADEFQNDGFPMILSHHNFDHMLSETELASLTSAMSANNPAAIKVIPTVTSLSEAATLLQWVESAEPGIRRIGFGMGQAGAISRILTLACGAPVTYTAFGAAVAPGQIALDDLQQQYRASELNAQTQVLALIDRSAHADQTCEAVNLRFSELGKNAICVRIKHNECPELIANSGVLRAHAIRIETADASQTLAAIGIDADDLLSPDDTILIEIRNKSAATEGLRSTPYSEQSMLALFD